MALPAVAGSLDDIPEAVREHYEERNGRYVLSVTPADGMALENFEALNKALAAERKTAREAAQALKPFQGLDPEDARAAIAELAAIKEKGPPDIKAQIQAAMQEGERKHAEQQKKLTESRDEAITQLKRQIRRADVTAAMAKHGATLLLEPHVERFVDVRADDEGRYRSVVIDESGNPRQALDHRGSMVDYSVDSLVAEMKTREEYQAGFAAAATGGSGAKPSTGHKAATNGDRNLTPRQRIEAQYAKTTTR